MPSQMIHLAIARNILKAVKCHDHGLFYLGCISPNAIHARKGSDQTDKNITHLHNSNHKVWENDAIKLLFSKKDSKDVSFYFGYVTHILSDIYWLHEIYFMTQQKILMDRTPIIKAGEAYYNDLVHADYDIFLKSSWKYDVFQLILNTPAPKGFELLTSYELDTWKKDTLKLYKDDLILGKPKLRYMKHEDVRKYIDKSSSKIIKFFS